MATERASTQSNATSALNTAQLVREHSHAWQNRLNTTQTDSSNDVNTAQPESDKQKPKADIETEAPKPAADTEPPAAEPTVADQISEEATAAQPVESPVGSAPVARESQISVGPMNETKVGGKRDIDSTVTSAPADAASTEQPKPDLLDEREAKKPKTDEKPVPDHNGATAAPSKPEEGKPKESRSKKERIKDAVKKVIPGDSIGSRTRSRTKGT